MIDTSKYKIKLEEEIKTLTQELQSVGRINPNNPADWEPLPDKMDSANADDNEKADHIESFEENTAILKQLEIRFNHLKDALIRIENGTYGICEKGGEQIEEEKLDANPATTTCKTHTKETI